jgi:hypothetical protein
MEDAPVKANSCAGGMGPALFDSRRQIGLTGLLLILLLPLPCLSQDRIKFPVAAQFKILGFAPLWAASQQGFFAKQGLDVQLTLTLHKISGSDSSSCVTQSAEIMQQRGSDGIIETEG